MRDEPRFKNAVALLDRGNCSFVDKALNAQAAGATGVLLVDNLGVCPSADYPGSLQCKTPLCASCPYRESDPFCQCFLRYMSDDGRGGSVLVPQFMVTKEDGEALKEAGASTRGTLLASMQWDVPAADGSLSYSLWTHSNDANAAALRTAWQPYLPFLGTAARFTPKMFIWDGQQIGCGSTFDCATQCVNNGTYCSADPDGDLYAGISGADVVLENLRQLCVWQVVAPSFEADFGVRWWRYADAFADACTGSTATWNEACSQAQMRAVGIDPAAVTACLLDSNSTFNAASHVYTNKLLQQQLDDRAEMMIVSIVRARRAGMCAWCGVLGAVHNGDPATQQGDTKAPNKNAQAREMCV